MFAAEDPSNDPICSLKVDERLRVCTIVLSSEYFEGKLEFVPQYDFVEKTDCKKRRISFQDEKIKAETDGKFYKEWTISCRPKLYYATYQEVYFLSRVYNSINEICLYRWGGGSKMIIENRFRNVRFRI